MEENKKLRPERVIELLKENGIIVSAEQAEQLLKVSSSPANMFFPLPEQTSRPQVLKGYKVYVKYDGLSFEEMNKKTTTVARIVCEGIKGIKK